MPSRYWQGARQDVGFKEIESYLLEAYSVFEEIISIHKKVLFVTIITESWMEYKLDS